MEKREKRSERQKTVPKVEKTDQGTPSIDVHAAKSGSFPISNESNSQPTKRKRRTNLELSDLIEGFQSITEIHSQDIASFANLIRENSAVGLLMKLFRPRIAKSK